MVIFGTDQNKIRLTGQTNVNHK